MSQICHFYDADALLDRLSKGLKKRAQEVVFLVGAPLSAPVGSGLPGVPGVDGVIELIRSEFSDSPGDLLALDSYMDSAGPRRYQAAFVFLQGRRGQHAANEIVQNAVRAARISEGSPSGSLQRMLPMTDDTCRFLEADVHGWALNPGTLSIGRLAAAYPERFGKSILTTNFDPLLEVSIRRSGGSYFRTTLYADGNFTQTDGMGCHVIHLHGYWYGADTLHTSQQLGHARPHLKDSLRAYLRNKLLVISGYGGWDDSFTAALMEVVSDDTAFPDILWALHTRPGHIEESLLTRISPGIDRGRVTLYEGIDCNVFFPRLLACWLALEGASEPRPAPQSNPVQLDPVPTFLREPLSSSQAHEENFVLEGDDQDRPPHVDICVGRDEELRRIRETNAKAIFVTGLGGQGKSTLAARYFEDCRKTSGRFSVYVWRDCKEESERFENQLCSVIETMTKGQISRESLARRDIASIVDILMRSIGDQAVLFVFDNIDHYVNLETERMTTGPDVFIAAMLKSSSPSKALFTSRPSINYDHELAMSFPLQGITLSAAVQLFTSRGASSLPEEIEDAHRLTDGHAFWLDLLAIQVAKRSPAVELSALVSEIRSGGGPLPEKTLTSIWSTLHEREKTVLHALAETVKPETEQQLSDYLSHKINFNKTYKAIKALRALNLLVIKLRADAPDLLELHPLVRQFIRRTFPLKERMSFIEAIIGTYQRFIGMNKKQLARRPALSVLVYWTQNAELDLAAGLTGEAFSQLAEVAPAFTSSAYTREFTRVTRMLLAKADWVNKHAQFRAFEPVFNHHVDYLAELGSASEVDGLLAQYAKTTVEKDARYINSLLSG
jgi:hypothetical protein